MEEFYTLDTDSTGNVCPHAFGEIVTVMINW